MRKGKKAVTSLSAFVYWIWETSYKDVISHFNWIWPFKKKERKAVLVFIFKMSLLIYTFINPGRYFSCNIIKVVFLKRTLDSCSNILKAFAYSRWTLHNTWIFSSSPWSNMIILHGHKCSLSPCIILVPTLIRVAIETYNTYL